MHTIKLVIRATSKSGSYNVLKKYTLLLLEFIM